MILANTEISSHFKMYKWPILKTVSHFSYQQKAILHKPDANFYFVMYYIVVIAW